MTGNGAGDRPIPDASEQEGLKKGMTPRGGGRRLRFLSMPGSRPQSARGIEGGEAGGDETIE
jgi:hypothetical protein